MNFSPNPAAIPPSDIYDESRSRWRLIRDLRNWWIDRMVSVPRGLEEKMVLFLHDHFATSAATAKKAWHMWEQNKLFRDHALGSFHTIVHNMAVQPAMLRYLDNWRNRAEHINENFARELLELHTLGPENYVEADIVGAAVAWTGYGLTDDGRYYQFRPYYHDYRDATIFGITKPWTGPEVIDEILLGSKKNESARFVADRLWTFFAYSEPESHVIDRMVNVYLANGLSLGAMVREMFLVDEFYSARAKEGLVRRPVDYVVACMRGAGSNVDEARPDWWLDEMGQELFYPTSPKGWKLTNWLSATTAWAKADFAGYLAYKAGSRDWLAEIEQLAVPDAVNICLGFFGIDTVTPSTRTALENYLYAERATWEWPQHRNMLRLTMLTPEIQVA